MRRRDFYLRPRPPASFDERVAQARRLAPEEPVAYAFVPEEGRGFFRIRAIVESDLKVRDPKKASVKLTPSTEPGPVK